MEFIVNPLEATDLVDPLGVTCSGELTCTGKFTCDDFTCAGKFTCGWGEMMY